MEKNTSPKIEQKEGVENNLEGTLKHIVEKLKPYFENSETIPLPAGKSLIRIKLETETEKEYVTELLDCLDIYPWEINSGLEIESPYDIQKLIIFDLIQEKVFEEGEILEEDFADERQEAKRKSLYDFPLPYSRIGYGSRDRKERREEESDEILESDKELFKIIENFDSGLGDGSQDNLKPIDIGFIKRLGNKFYWKNGKVFDKTTKNEITEEGRGNILKQAREGDEKSMEQAIRMNIGLVYFVYSNFSRFFPSNNPEEILSAGLRGLKYAIDKHDPEKGKLSTYAVISIEAEMRKEWKKDRTIHLPHHRFGERHEYHKAKHISEHEEENSNDVNRRIERELGIKSIDKFKEEYLLGEKYDPIELFLGENEQEVDTEQNIKTPGKLISLREEEPDKILDIKQRKKEIEKVLETLSRKERTVLIYRFGLNDTNEHTLEEIGSMFDVSRSRIAEIEAKALRRMRHYSRSEKLEQYSEGNYDKDMPFKRLSGEDISILRDFYDEGKTQLSLSSLKLHDQKTRLIKEIFKKLKPLGDEQIKKLLGDEPSD